jgi:SanA protein
MDTENARCGVMKVAKNNGLKSRRWRVYFRYACRALVLLLLMGIATILIIQHSVVQRARGKTYNDAQRISGKHVGLVFGCDDRFQNRENLYFTYRMDAAAALWQAGKLHCLIVSGDNRSVDYNEPRKMKQALIERGVPADKIVCDYAGLRTLDSVLRSERIFGVRRCVMISQLFQNERAIYIAESNGIDAIGFNARDVSGAGGKKTKLREFGARLMMWMDVHVLDTQPKHGGPAEALPM